MPRKITTQASRRVKGAWSDYSQGPQVADNELQNGSGQGGGWVSGGRDHIRTVRIDITSTRMQLALFAAVLLLSVSSPTPADETKPPAAIVIAARAELPDSNFKDSILLVMNNVGRAPVGVIINRPTRISVSQLFPENDRLAALQDKVYFGGPVGITTVSFLFRGDAPQEQALQVLDGVYFSMSIQLLGKLLRRDKPMDGLRIFAGYAGWAPGQLEAEIARGDWTLSPATSDTIFEKKPEHPWPDREPPGKVERI